MVVTSTGQDGSLTTIPSSSLTPSILMAGSPRIDTRSCVNDFSHEFVIDTHFEPHDSFTRPFMMSKILQKFMDAMTGSNSGSKRPSRGSDTNEYDHEPKVGSHFRSNHRTSDYGSRFESYGERPRPGTYGSGSYGPNRSISYDSTGRPHREDYGYHGEAAYARSDHTRTFSSGTDGYGSEVGARKGQGIEVGPPNGSGRYNRERAGFYGAGSYGYDSGERLAANGVQRNRW